MQHTAKRKWLAAGWKADLGGETAVLRCTNVVGQSNGRVRIIIISVALCVCTALWGYGTGELNGVLLPGRGTGGHWAETTGGTQKGYEQKQRPVLRHLAGGAGGDEDSSHRCGQCAAH
jgi:hypothetical protein